MIRLKDLSDNYDNYALWFKLKKASNMYFYI